MKCTKFRADFSAYVDHALETDRFARLRQHLDGCRDCSAEVSELAGLRSVLRSSRRVAPPSDLALAIRVRLSQQSNSQFLDRLRIRVQNLMAPVAVPAAAGLFAALLLFGILIHSFAIPTPAQTGPDEITQLLNTKPRLMARPPLTFCTDGQGLYVEIHVDPQGRIIDFRVLNGPQDPVTIAKLRSVLLFTQFDPATSFGVPRRGTAVFNFRSISVKG